MRDLAGRSLRPSCVGTAGAMNVTNRWGAGKVDQVSQGERLVREFDKNYALFLAGTMTYRFGR